MPLKLLTAPAALWSLRRFSSVPAVSSSIPDNRNCSRHSALHAGRVSRVTRGLAVAEVISKCKQSPCVVNSSP